MNRTGLLLGAATLAILAGIAPALADSSNRLAGVDTTVSLTPLYGTVQPFYGAINPFYGSINPFYGSINPFYGKISPFWGDVTPFYGSINPFYGSINPFYGSINPFWGKINPFTTANSPMTLAGAYWQNAGPQWGAINASWDALQASNATDYSSVQSQLNSFIQSAAATWSAPMKGAIKNSTFAAFFASPLFAQYGIDPTNAASLANVTGAQRSAFFLDFYDSLMNYTGTDHVDWWMGAVHWSPMLAQIQGSANNAAVGILDAYTTQQNADVQKLDFAGGYNNKVLDHGAAVASLIAAKQDGVGVMGVAPNATIQVLYNPFDSTGTASWADVATGISTLFARKASVINASLGVSGSVLSSEWSSILNSASLVSIQHQVVLVKAAGNDGITQTADVPWSGPAPNNLILVGSVDPTNTISSFSNTPGEACILVNGICNEQNKLKYRFIVAPGELLLVEDNHGGVTRASGTSFAAPLVTGAISLLQDRWPWLQQHAEETTQIILQSATDLGAPGVDPVYGWGELNIEASQSPLNWDNLAVYQPKAVGANGGDANLNLKDPNNPLGTAYTSASLKATVLAPGQLNLWQQQGAYLVAFETIGTTYRDFEIPLSTVLIGRNANIGAGNNPFQTYLYQRLIDWSNGVKSLNYSARQVPLSDGAWKLDMVTTEASPDEVQRGSAPVHAEFIAANPDAGFDIRLGEGSGAHALMGDGAFALRSDYDPSTGGVNPVLGLASGGMYASGGYTIAKGLRLGFGFSQKSDDHVYIDPTFGPLKSVPLDTNRASASVASIEYSVAPGLRLNASYTQLGEANGLLGAQGSGLFALGGGSRTQGTTLGLTAALAGGWSLSGSATLARTTAPHSANAALQLAESGLQSTALELVATKASLFTDLDSLRISFAQPLHVESGSLNYTSIAVVDRATGELGSVTQNWDISGNREYRMEAMYGLPLLEGKASVNAFGLIDLNPPTEPSSTVAVTVGGQFQIDL